MFINGEEFHFPNNLILYPHCINKQDFGIRVTRLEKKYISTHYDNKNLQHNTTNSINEKNNRHFKLQNITLEETNKIIQTLKNNTTTGSDSIDHKTIITLSRQLLKLLTYLINLSSKEGIFSSFVQSGLIILIFKAREKTT